MNTTTYVQAFLASRRSRGISPGTAQNYAVVLSRFASACAELPTRPEPIEDFLTRLRVAPSTRRQHLWVLRAFFRWLERRFGLPNPIAEVETPLVPRTAPTTLSVGELHRLLYAEASLRNKAMLLLFADTGIRTSELAGLRKSDLGDGYIEVRGKTGLRAVPVSPETETLLRTWARGCTDYLFAGPSGRPLGRDQIYRIVHRLMVQVGIEGRRRGAHRIRHAFALHYIRAGGDPFTLQAILGHAQITTTQRYVDLAARDIAGQHRRYTPLRAIAGAAQYPLPLEEEENASSTVLRS